jgi:hypothetical protein
MRILAVQKVIQDRRALLVLRVRKACRVFPVLRDSRALKVRRARGCARTEG